SGTAGSATNGADQTGKSDDTNQGSTADPATCAETAQVRTSVGCDFWPTVVANPVWTDFDFGVVVMNTSASQADLTIDGPKAFQYVQSVPPDQSLIITLPWVTKLKGPEFSRTNTSGNHLKESVRVNDDAYHLRSSVPVHAWQYNPLEYH